MMSKNDNVIRIGDTIKILDHTKFIIRVGYPLIWTDFYSDLFDDEKTKELAKSVGIAVKNPAYSSFVKALAMSKVEEENFGGNERKIIYEDSPSFWNELYYKNRVFQVTGKKIAKTGTRFPSCDGYDAYNGEYWYEPGGLLNEKTHILVQIDHGRWIESIHLEKIRQ